MSIECIEIISLRKKNNYWQKTNLPSRQYLK